MAKVFYTPMIAEGVDVQDDDAVDEWMREFRASDAGRRRSVLAHAPAIEMHPLPV